MLIIIMICCAFFGLLSMLGARLVYIGNVEEHNICSVLLALFAVILGFSFSSILIFGYWNLFTIPIILLLFSLYMYICFKEEFEPCFIFWLFMIITIVAFIISGAKYAGRFEKCETPDIETSTTEIIYSSNTDNIFGDIIYVTEEKSYMFFIPSDKDKELIAISENDIEIVYITTDEKPYLETIATTTYYWNTNKKPAKRCLNDTETTYKLYIYEDSVTKIKDFNIK